MTQQISSPYQEINLNLPKVALVGRPNVGKSTLFNRLIGKRRAVVADVPGTTRDRLDEILKWNGINFVLTDMAGLEPTLANGTEISKAAQAQVEKALQVSQVIVWVVDSTAGVQFADEQASLLLRSLNKPVIVAVNKTDSSKRDLDMYEFAQFGFEPVIPVSAIHGRGVEELFNAIGETLELLESHPSKTTMEAQAEERELNISIVGRPNVGKSTLLNALAGEDRSLVSTEAGTTRDSVDTVVAAESFFERIFTRWRTVRFVDTAGIRRRGKIGHEIEAWSVLRSLDSIDRSQVVLFIIDASEGIVHQDLQVASLIIKAGKPMVLVANKWDMVLEENDILAGTAEDKEMQTQFFKSYRAEAPFLNWASVLFVSANQQYNLSNLGKLAVEAYNAWNLKAVEGEMLKTVADKLRVIPALKNLQKIVMIRNRPPVFHVMVEGKKLPHFSAVRMVENYLRQLLKIGSTPIKIWVVPSIKKVKQD